MQPLWSFWILLTFIIKKVAWCLIRLAWELSWSISWFPVEKKEKYIYKTNPRTERHEYNPLILWVEFLYCAKKIRNFAEKFISSTTPSLNIASIKNLFMTTGNMSRFLYFYKQDCKYLSISLSLSSYLPNYLCTCKNAIFVGFPDKIQGIQLNLKFR